MAAVFAALVKASSDQQNSNHKIQLENEHSAAAGAGIDSIQILNKILLTVLQGKRNERNKNLALKLIENPPVDLNQRDENNSTPLIFAVQRMYVEVVDKLVENGAEVNLMDDFGRTALSLALELVTNPFLENELNQDQDTTPNYILENIVHILLSSKNISESIKLLLTSTEDHDKELAKKALTILDSRAYKLFLSLLPFTRKYKKSDLTSYLQENDLGLAIAKNEFSAFKIMIDNSDFFSTDDNLVIHKEVENDFGHKFTGKWLNCCQTLAILKREEMLAYALSKPALRILFRKEYVHIVQVIGVDTFTALFKKLDPHVFERTKQKDVIERYQKLFFEIWQEKLAAQKSGKKLLLILGEDHYSAYTFALKNIILNICSQLKINKFLVELDGTRLKEQLSGKPKMYPKPPNTVFYFGALVMTLNYALSNGMDILPIDWMDMFAGIKYLGVSFRDKDISAKNLLRERLSANNLLRERVMAYLTAQYNQDSVMLIGCAHMKSVLQELSSLNQFHIVLFNLLPGSDDLDMHRHSYDTDMDEHYILSLIKGLNKIQGLRKPTIPGSFFTYDSIDADKMLKKITRASLQFNINAMASTKKGQVLLPTVNPDMLWMHNSQKEQYAVIPDYSPQGKLKPLSTRPTNHNKVKKIKLKRESRKS